LFVHNFSLHFLGEGGKDLSDYCWLQLGYIPQEAK
jgi:hypothetical protein